MLCFKKVTSDAVWSPFDDSLFYNISVFSDLKFVTSVNTVNVVPLSVSFMADSVLPVTRYATTFIFVLFALGQRRLKLSNDVEENPGPDPDPVSVPNNDNSTKLEVEVNSLSVCMARLECSLQSKLDNILLHIQTQ